MDEGPAIDTKDLETIGKNIRPMEDTIRMIKDSHANIVSIGEGSHGTKEFYEFRCEISKQLIIDGRINCVLLEGDWPDCAALHRYVMGMTEPGLSVDDAMAGLFLNFPRWMWRNETMKTFLKWLRGHNAELPVEKRCGIFGMDVYSLHLSMSEVLRYLQEHDPETAEIVANEYHCFDKFGDDAQVYGRLVTAGLSKGCREAALAAVNHIAEARSMPYTKSNLPEKIFAEDDNFIAQMNARVVVEAEKYYTSMFDPSLNSWNIRDTHFFNTMVAVREHLLRTRGNNRVVLWAHNSHLGDARHTHLDASARQSKELNIGQLIKQSYEQESITVGQLTYKGTVMAAHDWGSKPKVKNVRKGLPNSHEEFFHKCAEKSATPNFSLDMRTNAMQKALQASGPRLQRAIGVIYRPQTERLSHYYFCDIPKQFDILCFWDVSSAVVPLDTMALFVDEPETFPSGL